MRIPWTLSENPDEVMSPVTYSLPINPDTADSPQLSKSDALHRANRQNLAIVEKHDEPTTMKVSGVILTEDHYDQSNTWFDKQVMLILTDDILREFLCVITDFTPTREKARVTHPWRHRYDMSFLILEEL